VLNAIVVGHHQQKMAIEMVVAVGGGVAVLRVLQAALRVVSVVGGGVANSHGVPAMSTPPYSPTGKLLASRELSKNCYPSPPSNHLGHPHDVREFCGFCFPSHHLRSIASRCAAR
jgi:hypothetical protein